MGRPGISLGHRNRIAQCFAGLVDVLGEMLGLLLAEMRKSVENVGQLAQSSRAFNDGCAFRHSSSSMAAHDAMHTPDRQPGVRA